MTIVDVPSAAKLKEYTRKSQKFSFTKEDSNNDVEFNRVLWHGLMGDTPLPGPTRAAFIVAADAEEIKIMNEKCLNRVQPYLIFGANHRNPVENKNSKKKITGGNLFSSTELNVCRTLLRRGLSGFNNSVSSTK